MNAQIRPDLAALDITRLMGMSPIHIRRLQKQGVSTIGDGLAYLYKSINERLRGKKQKKYESWFTDFMMDLAYLDPLPEVLVNEIYDLIFTYPLDWLQCQQGENGGWEGDLDQTLAATLAFVRVGNTARRGRYAGNVARALRWLEQDRPLKDSTIAYAFLRVLGEHYNIPYPEPPFELPKETSPWTLEEVRRWAILRGHAPRLAREEMQWLNWDENRFWNAPRLYRNVEIAWMIVGVPKPTPR